MMKIRRPRSLNGLILVGFGIVTLPLLVAVIWALVNLDRLAAQSEELVNNGRTAAENNRRLTEQVGALDRHARQYQVLRNADGLQLVRQDVVALERVLNDMVPLTERADSVPQLQSIAATARRILTTLAKPDASTGDLQTAIDQIGPLRQGVTEFTGILTAYVDRMLNELQESTRRAQQVSAWQVAALVPGTLVLVLFFILLVAKPIRQLDNAISQLGQSGFAKPIEVKGPTDLQRLGRQLEWLRLRLLELAQEKNRFLRHMSHELKTPLANIREGTELLLDGTVGQLDSGQREVTDILRMNGLKLQQLIENLLSFSAWQTKTEVLTLSDFPVRDLVISVAKAQRLALKAANIQLKLEIDELTVNADREKIRTVLDNLLSNAIKFTPRAGLITVRAFATKSGFVLEFGDTGPGIPDDESPRIFEAFFQGRREQGGQVAGTGIGLSVVLECIQAHDGTVELVNTGEFPGAHFRIEIPQRRVRQKHRLAVNA